MSVIVKLATSTIITKVRGNYLLSVPRRSAFSFAQLVGTFLGINKSQAEPKMSSLADLEQKIKKLEARVYELVDQLEAQKKPGELKVSKEQVIRAKEEREASEAVEKLKIDESEDKKSKTDGGQTTGVGANSGQRQQEQRKGKQKGARKERAAAPPAPERAIDVSRLDLRIGKILEVDRHPDADALYVEKIDCGDPTGPRTVISGLVKHVPMEEMRNRNVVVLCNLKPAKMRGILSEAMVMCASTPDKVELLGTPDGAQPGDRVVFDGYPGEPDVELNPKKKIWEQVAVDIKTDGDGVAVYKECQFKISGKSGQFRSNLKNVQIR